MKKVVIQSGVKCPRARVKSGVYEALCVMKERDTSSSLWVIPEEGFALFDFLLAKGELRVPGLGFVESRSGSFARFMLEMEMEVAA